MKMMHLYHIHTKKCVPYYALPDNTLFAPVGYNEEKLRKINDELFVILSDNRANTPTGKEFKTLVKRYE